MRELIARIEINTPPHAVWDVLADFGNVADWAPYMRKSGLVGERKSGIGTSRTMRHAWGFRFVETVTDWNPGTGFSFDVLRAPFPMRDVRESWRIERREGCATVITRVAYDMRLGWGGALLDRLMVRFIVLREMRTGLHGLKHYVEYEAGRDVAPQEAD